MPGTTVAAFYHFADIARPEALVADLQRLGEAAGLRGSVLVAAEGVNGTVAGPRAGIDRLIGRLRAVPGFDAVRPRLSAADSGAPFARFKVRLKREIVTMGRPDIRPADATGSYVAPRDWNALIDAPDVAVIDTRNAYEIAIGSFAGAIDPGIDSFRAFPGWWQANAPRLAGRRVAMFCTGGIRCEKATALLRAEGREVFHLKGGILAYLAEIAPAESRWRGECFVFDQRVALGHGLAQGEAVLCHACRRPVTPADRAAAEWEDGVSCPRCIGAFTDADRARFRERQRQIALAAARGARHLA